MGAALDYSGGEDLYTGGVGYQPDGTFYAPSSSVMSQPVDAGGGAPAQYGAQILDIFKFGVGAWQQADARKDMIDLRRWEATNAGLYQQGQSAAIYGSRGQVGILGIAAVGVILFLALKG
jgi:hypothetical protein